MNASLGLRTRIRRWDPQIGWIYSGILNGFSLDVSLLGRVIRQYMFTMMTKIKRIQTPLRVVVSHLIRLKYPSTSARLSVRRRAASSWPSGCLLRRRRRHLHIGVRWWRHLLLRWLLILKVERRRTFWRKRTDWWLLPVVVVAVVLIMRLVLVVLIVTVLSVPFDL